MARTDPERVPVRPRLTSAGPYALRNRSCDATCDSTLRSDATGKTRRVVQKRPSARVIVEAAEEGLQEQIGGPLHDASRLAKDVDLVAQWLKQLDRLNPAEAPAVVTHGEPPLVTALKACGVGSEKIEG